MDGELGHVYSWQPLGCTQTGVGDHSERYCQEVPPRQLRTRPETCIKSETSPKGPQLLHQAGCHTCPGRQGGLRSYLPQGGLPPLPLPRPTPPLHSPPQSSQNKGSSGSPRQNTPIGRAEEAEEPNVTESNPGYCCLRLARAAACHWLCLMRRCGSRAPPPTGCQGGGYKGLRVQAGTGPLGPAPWEPQHPAQVRQALLSPGPEAWIKGLNLGLRQGLAGFRREGGLVGKEAVVGGQGLWEEL